MRKLVPLNRLVGLTLILSGQGALAITADANFADPTRPSGFSESSAAHETASAKLSLTLVRLGAEPLAVINGKNVQPGGTIDGYRLVSLQPTGAVLVGSNGRLVLQLSPAIRKPSNFSAQTR